VFPEHIAVVPEHIAVVPEHIAVFPDLIAVVPEHIAVFPEHIAVVPEHIAVFPEHIAVVPEHIAVVPEHIAVVPEHIAVFPNMSRSDHQCLICVHLRHLRTSLHPPMYLDQTNGYHSPMSHGRLLALVCAVWVASELIVMVLKHARGNASRRDRGSLRVLWGGITIATVCGSLVSGYRPTALYGTYWLGLALIILGIIVRAVAIATLWRYFTVDVSIREGHELVDRGLYSVIRHPAYTGSLLSFLGLGFAFGNWLSVAIITAMTILGFSYRIAVEEGALIEHFGDRYRDYMRRSKRLIPGIY